MTTQKAKAPAAAKAATAPIKASAPAARKTTKDPVTYTAPHEVYTGGILYKPNQPFTTSEPKGAQWEETDPVQAAAAVAADVTRHDDPNLDELDADQLLVVAASRGIAVGEVTDKDGLLAIIKAQHAPAAA